MRLGRGVRIGLLWDILVWFSEANFPGIRAIVGAGNYHLNKWFDSSPIEKCLENTSVAS